VGDEEFESDMMNIMSNHSICRKHCLSNNHSLLTRLFNMSWGGHTDVKDCSFKVIMTVFSEKGVAQ